MLPPLAFLSNMSPVELTVILLVALLIFGNKLPSVARSLGSSVGEFKNGIKGIQEADTDILPRLKSGGSSESGTQAYRNDNLS